MAIASGSRSAGGASRWTLAVLVLTIGALLGFNVVAVKVAIRDAGPLSVQALATVAGAAMMAVWAAAGGVRSRPSWQMTRTAIVVSLIMTVGASVALSYGVQRIEAGLAALIMSVTPILTLAMSVVFLGERRSWHGVAGMVLGLVGVGIVSTGAGLRGGSDEAVGIALLLGGALGWSSGLIVMRTMGHGLSGAALTTWQMILGAPVLVVLAALAEGVDIIWTWPLASAVVYMGFFAKGMGTLLQVHTLRIGSPVHASLTAFVMPLFGIAGGIVLLGESLTPSEVAGAAAILGGVAMVLCAREGGREPSPPPR